MADEATTAPAAPVVEGASADPETPTTEQAPPWGENFDPARAWSTIQAQRAAEAELKKELASFRQAQKEKEDAEKSEAQKLAEAIEAAKKDAAEARRELLVSRAAVKHSIPADYLEFLTGATAEAVEAQAVKLAAMLAGKPTAEPPAPEVPGKPKPALVPGQGGDEAPGGIDPEALAKSIRARRY